ncbi:hypothetical protein AWM70_22220 [Paenibacillus yonginensis]|uniref:DUF58 domain-containing protein n=1 Tax=Paenibacillus yonginensis TaxID=1462996 RepID=A0A1B1N6C3_9BACL|nr:DUF58 domain-containing protein [Paenibacillus yonginensis]ANS76962.1 hypothetical protein AWM70_22220 [Paenibacillus yonginensis]
MKAAGVWAAAGLVWALLLGILVWHGGRTALFMLAVLTFILLQGACARWLGPKQVFIRREYSAVMPVAGERIGMRLVVKMKGGLPPVWLKLRDEFGGEAAEYAEFAGFRRHLVIEAPPRSLPRGIYGQEKLTVSHSDLFGWFSYKRPSTVSGLLPVLPVPAPVAGGELRGEGQEQERRESAEERLVPTGQPGGSIRGYLPGDPMKAIDWKISARRGEWAVRAPEKEEALVSIVLLVTERDAYEGGPRKQEWQPGRGGRLDAAAGPPAAAQAFEAAVSAAAYLLAEAAAQGHAVMFRHGGMDRLCRWNPHSLGEEGPAGLAGLSLGAGSWSGAEMLAAAVRGCPGVPVTVITGTADSRLLDVNRQLAEWGASIRLLSCGLLETGTGNAGAPVRQAVPAGEEAKQDADVSA